MVAAPAPDVEILTFTPLGPVLAVRPYCHNDHYWQVYFDTNRSIREVGGEGKFPAPRATRLHQRDEVVSAGRLSALGDRAMGALRSGCAHMSEP